MLVDLYRQGRFDLDAFVTETIGIDDVEAAFDKMHRGEVLRSVVTSVSGDRSGVDRVVTSGTFSLDGGTWDVENNVWVIGDDTECVVIDAAHDGRPILRAVAGGAGRRRSCAPTPTTTTSPPRASWPTRPARRPTCTRPTGCSGTGSTRHPGRRARRRRRLHGRRASTLRVLHTPGHAPGACCFYAPGARAPSSPATPCSTAGRARRAARTATSRPSSESIRDRLLTLPPETVVHTGHGDDTTIGAEAPHLQEWIDPRPLSRPPGLDAASRFRAHRLWRRGGGRRTVAVDVWRRRARGMATRR